MKILFYLSRFPGWGGIESVTETIGCRLAEMGYEISILAHVRQERPSALLQKAAFHLLPDDPLLKPDGSGWDTPANRAFACELAARERYDIIIYQDSYAPTEGIVLEMAKICGARLIVFEHSTPMYRRILKRRLKFFKFRRALEYDRLRRLDDLRHLSLLRQAQDYVVLSESFRKELQQICQRQPDDPLMRKVRVIHNPLVELSHPVAEEEKENTLLFVGQLNADKRVDLLIKMWKKLFRDFPEWKLQIIGDGPIRATLQEQCVRENIQRVEFCGFQHPDSYYRKAKLFWMASSFEGWPMTLTEAMQRGCVPVIMESFSSLREILQHNTSGKIIRNGDTRAFIEASRTLMGDEPLRQKLSQGAIAQAARFDLSHIISNWTQMLENQENTQRKRFLVIAPELDGNAPAFVLRNVMLALARHADLDIFTSQFGDIPVPEGVRTFYSGHMRGYKWERVDRYWRWFHCNPDDLNWYFRVRHRVRRQIRGTYYDAVLTLSSATTMPTIMVGGDIARYLKCKWLIYCVDAIPSPVEWMEGFFGSHDRIARYVDRICRDAQVFYLSNYWMAEYEKKICPSFKGRWDWLYTCPRKWEDYPRVEHEGLVILYTGALYGKRSVSGIKDALASLAAKGKNIKMIFVGDVAPAFEEELKPLTEQGIVEIHPFQDNIDDYYTHADILLDIGADMDYDIFLSSKIISYLPISRPILGISGIPSPARDVMKDCPGMVHCRNIGDEIEAGILQCEQMLTDGFESRASFLEQFKPETVALKLYNDMVQ